MTRPIFGGTANDVLVGTGPDGALRYTSGALTFWDAATAGTQYVDLVLNSLATAAIPVGANGQIPRFQGPDGVTEMWADGGGGTRVLVQQVLAIRVVPVGTTGYATAPDGTFWIEYIP